MRYRQVLAGLEELTGTRVNTIHVIGGGTQNRQLCQATADACGRTVVAGPIEATAIGNIMTQAVAAGVGRHIGEAREVIRAASRSKNIIRVQNDRWNEAAARFDRLK